MEIEFKYRPADDLVADKIFEDEYISKLKLGDFFCVEMRAVYFDTLKGDLMKNKMAFRIRREDDKSVATLKWSGGSVDGLHVREEINRVPDDEKMLAKPTIEIFRDDCKIYDKLKKTVQDRTLVPVMETNFTRKRILLDTGRSISEFSFDSGEIIAGGKSVPICEIEIEFIDGERDDFIKLGEAVAKRYKLMPGDMSKFERGIKLLHGQRCLL